LREVKAPTLLRQTAIRWRQGKDVVKVTAPVDSVTHTNKHTNRTPVALSLEHLTLPEVRTPKHLFCGMLRLRETTT
jgi:hypothetical protein